MARVPHIALLCLAALALLALGVLPAGCGTPRERYRTLSTFFDGVPDPDAAVAAAATQPAGEAQATVTVSMHSVHKPFADKQCEACHRSAAGLIQDFSLAYDACVKCHKQVPTEHRLMHGPVARAACKYCHEPHESSHEHLLKDNPVTVCTQCHDQQLLGSDPPEHLDGKTSCLNCHFGHGGDARNFLKPVSAPAAPATAVPAATQAATRPAADKEPAP